ncbi:creatininase family protein [Sphaerisporangium sp. NPDC051011]|uniref:creatininase family protein n=1 Tax=Sphaerisporangium sp. NPDC051011 TaxID=3155792 RepID=UPI0033C4ACEA
MNHLLTTATTTDEQARNASLAILPVGSFEQHGHHLPLITDTVVASLIAREIADAYNVFVLPPVTISCSHEHSKWRGTVSISSQTLYAIVNDVYDSVTRSGISALVIVNGHGGNYVLGNVVQEANAAGKNMALFPAKEDWAEARDAAQLTTSMYEDMHAGEIETSILLYAHPELVREGYESADWTAPDRRHLLISGMQAYTTSGVIGRPSLGTAEKGKTVLDSLTRSFAAVSHLLDNR